MININQKLIGIGIFLIILLISNIFICGCVNPPSEEDKKSTLENVDEQDGLEDKDIDNEVKTNITEQDLNITTEDLQNIINATNQFSFDFYSEICKNNSGNIFFSPYSIFSAFGIVYEGARDKTATEIQSVFKFPLNDEIRRKSFLNVYNEINKENKSYQLNTANALWAEKDYEFLSEYFQIIEKYYGGNVTNLDFKNNPEDSRKIINSWVENQTNNKIKDLIPPNVIDYLTRLVITNAIYFKGNWMMKFDTGETKDKDFYININNSVKTPMMTMEEKFNYTNTKEFQILELPYDGDDLSMLILLPNDNNLSSIEGAINTKNLTDWRNNLTEENINIFIPKFKFETKYLMVETLKNLGIESAFNPNKADLSGMDGTDHLYISSAIHQAFVEVNEEGTEAAAATAVVVSYDSVTETPIFRADHPFIFLIQDRDSGNILFMGRVMDPTK